MIKSIGPIALAALVLAAAATPVFADDDSIETQLVDTLNKLFGVHPGFRANHAKGIVTEGHFKASPDAAALSSAVIFDGSIIPVTIRFSDSTGLPNIPDGSGDANPHGMAIKYHLPDGTETDMVIVSIRFFPVASGEDFRDLLLAIGASPEGAPKPTKLDQFFAAHPAAPKALSTAATPDSFADEIYYGVDAFIFTNKAGQKQAVRYQAVPEKIVHLDEAAAAKQTPDFLLDELPQRLAKGPVTFHLKAQLAAPGDPTNDATKPWPDDRKLADLGVLTVEKAVPNSLEAQKELLFLPGQVIDGIDISDDPLINVRDGAYAVSFSRRGTP
jgi:catalase